MNSFLPSYINSLSIPVGVSIIHGLCAEAKGKERFWTDAEPELLVALQEQSIISSAESSNRIEGVEVEPGRLGPLMSGRVSPRSRPEEEVVGYRNALRYIHSNAKSLEITPELIQELHRLAQSGEISDAGSWKSRNNEIIEISPDGKRSIRFCPPPPELVPHLMTELCLGYRDAVSNARLPDLFLIATFVFDFLCIHPFRDGNGRVSRLLLLLLLYQHDYNVGRYVSLEKIVEDSKVEYYEALKGSSALWHENQHDLTPIWKYILRTVRQAYEQLATKVSLTGLPNRKRRGAKTDLIRSALLGQNTNFTFKAICEREPGFNRALVKKVLYMLRDEGLVELVGKGRGAYWRRVKNP